MQCLYFDGVIHKDADFMLETKRRVRLMRACYKRFGPELNNIMATAGFTTFFLTFCDLVSWKFPLTSMEASVEANILTMEVGGSFHENKFDSTGVDGRFHGNRITWKYIHFHGRKFTPMEIVENWKLPLT